MRGSTCPYCFDLMPHQGATFRCMNTDPAKCALELDANLAAYRGIPASLEQRVFMLPVPFYKRLPTKGNCRCGYESVKRICPKCHNSLPSQFDSRRNMTFGLIGAKFSGKSNFIGVLIDRLMREVGRNLGCSLNALDGETSARYDEVYKRSLFERQEVVPISQSLVADRSSLSNRYPLNYSFSRRSRHALQPARAIGLSLFDTAGEDLKKDDFITTQVRYIGNARGLIFILDPLQLPGLQGTVPKPKERLTDPAELIDTVMRILRTKHNIGPARKIKIPVAVVFSKIDLIRPLVDSNSPLNCESFHNGVYDEIDGQKMHQSIRSYLVHWGAEPIDNTMEIHFSNYRYFGVSSFGYQPTEDGRLTSGIMPFRVEDPFLWLLAQVGFIGKAKPEKKR